MSQSLRDVVFDEKERKKKTNREKKNDKREIVPIITFALDGFRVSDSFFCGQSEE